MLRRPLLCFALAALVALSLAVDEQAFANGFFPGRSGDMLVTEQITQADSYLYFLSQDSLAPKFRKTALEETVVGDLISHLMGTPPLHPNLDRSDFPKDNFFKKPKANVMFVADSTPLNPEELRMLGSSPKHALTSSSIPRSTLASLTSMLTGTTPSMHGIVTDAWVNPKGETVSAYEAWCPGRAGARSATVHDMAAVSFGGNSLIISASSDLKVARALSAKQSLLKEDSRHYGFFWNEGAFDSVYTERLPEIMVSETRLKDFLGSYFTGGSVVYSAESNQMTVVLPEGTRVVFDLNQKEEFAFAVELGFVLIALNELENNQQLSALVKDATPDFFSFGFSLKDVESKYGRGSAEHKAAFFLVDVVVSQAVRRFSGMYDGRVLAEALFIGAGVSANRHAIAQKAKALLLPQLVNPEDVEVVFPQLFLSFDLTEEQKTEACSYLRTALREEFADVEVVCSPRPSLLLNAKRFADEEYSDSDRSEDVAIFQIVLWMSIALIFAILAAALIMFSIDASKDTLLYNQPTRTNFKPT